MVGRTALTETSESSKWSRVPTMEGLGLPHGDTIHPGPGDGDKLLEGHTSSGPWGPSGTV